MIHTYPERPSQRQSDGSTSSSFALGTLASRSADWDEPWRITVEHLGGLLLELHGGDPTGGKPETPHQKELSRVQYQLNIHVGLTADHAEGKYLTQ